MRLRNKVTGSKTLGSGSVSLSLYQCNQRLYYNQFILLNSERRRSGINLQLISNTHTCRSAAVDKLIKNALLNRVHFNRLANIFQCVLLNSCRREDEATSRIPRMSKQGGDYCRRRTRTRHRPTPKDQHVPRHRPTLRQIPPKRHRWRTETMTGTRTSRQPIAGHQRAGRASSSGYDASLGARRSASGASPASPKSPASPTRPASATRPARPACLAHL